MRRETIVIVLCLTIMAMPLPRAIGAGATEIVVEGSAVLEPELDRCIDAAILDAMRRGIEQALGVMVDATVIVSNSELVRDVVANRATGYVAGYEVVSQRIVDGVVYVMVRMTIKDDVMADDLQSLRAALLRKGDPRVVVVVVDTVDGRHVPNSIVGMDLEEALASRGYRVVSAHGSGIYYDRDLVLKAVAGDPWALKTLASGVDAETLIVGMATADYRASMQGLVSYVATCNVRIISTGDAAILSVFSASGNGVAATHSEASAKALTSVGSSSAARLVEALPRIVTTLDNVITIVVNNVTLSDVDYLQWRLKGMRFVDRMLIRRFEHNQVVFEVVTSLTAAQVAQDIEIRKMGYSVVSILGNRIDIIKN